MSEIDILMGKLGHLTRESTNDEIQKAAINFVHDMGYVIVSTVKTNGDPAARGVEVHYLDDTETLYIGMAPGKPMYSEIMKHPTIACTAVQLTGGRLSESVRLNAHCEPIDPEKEPKIYERYWELNPGTKALYIKDLDRFRIFKLDKGNGRIFHMAGDDIVQNSLFAWGGESNSEWAYDIDEDKCIGCGTCQDLCMEDVIDATAEGKFRIDHFECLECGRCLDVCPNNAVICRIK